MNAVVDPLPQGVPFALGEAFFAALRADPVLADAKCLSNPTRLTDLTDGARIVFIEDAGDSPASEVGKRTYRFTLGVINRSQAARQSAHADYRAAKRAVRAALASLRSVVQVATSVREGDVVYRLENIDVGGALVLGTFTVDYRDPGN